MKWKTKLWFVLCGLLSLSTAYGNTDWSRSYIGFEHTWVTLDVQTPNTAGTTLSHTGNDFFTGITIGQYADYGVYGFGIKGFLSNHETSITGTGTVRVDAYDVLFNDTLTIRPVITVSLELGVEPAKDWLVTPSLGFAYLEYGVAGTMSVAPYGSVSYADNKTIVGTILGIEVTRTITKQLSVTVSFNRLHAYAPLDIPYTTIGSFLFSDMTLDAQMASLSMRYDFH